MKRHALGWVERLVRDLSRENPERLLTRRSYRDPGFHDHLMPWLDERIYRDPQAALSWCGPAAHLADLIAVDPDDVDSQEHRGRRVRGHVLLGGCRRAVGDLPGAEAAYAEALKISKTGPISKFVTADRDRRLSTLRACQGRTEDALKLISPAVETLRKLGDPSLPDALVALGFTLDSAGRIDEEIAALSEALATAQPTKAGKRVRAVASRNVAILLVGANKLEGALGYLEYARGFAPTGSPETYILLWASGAVHERLGSHHKAERLYLKALAGYERLRLPWEAALLGLDLCALYHLTGEHYRMEQTALRAFELFRNLSGANAKVLQALSLWRDAVRQRTWDGTPPEVRDIILARVASGNQRCKSRRRL